MFWDRFGSVWEVGPSESDPPFGGRTMSCFLIYIATTRPVLRERNLGGGEASVDFGANLRSWFVRDQSCSGVLAQQTDCVMYP